MKNLVHPFAMLGYTFIVLVLTQGTQVPIVLFMCGASFGVAIVHIIEVISTTNPDGSPKFKQQEHMRNEILSGTTNDWIAAQRAAFHRDEDIQ
jgi:hypothetical protein